MKSSSRTLLIVGAVAAGVYFLTQRDSTDALLKARAEDYVRVNILRPLGWDGASLMATGMEYMVNGQAYMPVKVLSGGVPGGATLYLVDFSEDGYPIRA